MKLKQLLLFIIILLASCYVSFSLVAQPTTAGLLAHFKLNGNTTNSGPANVSASAINTSYTTNNTNTANSAVQLGGNLTSLIEFTDNGNLDFSGTNNFSISFSFFFNGNSTGGLIDNCLNYGGWGIWLWSTVSGNWNLQFNYKNNSVGSAAATAFTLNNWHHVVAARNNGTISLYIDGVFRLSAPEGTTAPTYPINMIAGAMGYAGNTPPRYNPFNGKIDEIRVFNRALSAAEIAVLAPYSLPLKMGDFTAVKTNNGIQLDWETITEQNTSHFEIERSSDAVNYTAIGNVNATGNSTDKRVYNFTDPSPLPKVNFYRLKMVDIDKAFTYSKVVAVKNDAALFTLELFPNPASDMLQVQLPAAGKETTKVMIMDAGGKQLHVQPWQLNKGINAMSLPVKQLTAGTYYLIIEGAGGKQSRSFIKI